MLLTPEFYLTLMLALPIGLVLVTGIIAFMFSLQEEEKSKEVMKSFYEEEIFSTEKFYEHEILRLENKISDLEEERDVYLLQKEIEEMDAEIQESNRESYNQWIMERLYS